VPRSGNEKAYEHIDRIKRTILGTGKVAYDKEFAWEVFIVKNDKVLNAFATPGGYLYFYTGLINFCSNEAELAGVMAHEVAHAANRHSSSQMTKVLGLQVVKAIVFGNDTSSLKSYTADLAIGASALKFSRDDEYAADKHAVDYLYNTEYHAPELAQFFVKMQNQSRVKPPEFLSTHPSDDNRIKKINEEWKNKGGKSGQLFESRYAEFKALLK
jgi:predicted Zn-dependent protease